MQPKELSIVCPLYNEQANIARFLARIEAVMAGLDMTYEIICVNDGSTDHTLARLLDAKGDYPRLRIINLSRNFGKEAALTAGLDYSTGGIIIPIDADLQDPPELIPELIAEWKKGFDVVLAKRVDRNADSFLKKTTANLFYRFHNRISATRIPDNCGDFRLITRQVAEAVRQLPENQRFMKGVFAWVGFRISAVEYSRESRAAGYSKFGFWKLWNFALDGITSFSTAPLRIWLYIGFIVAALSFSYGGFIVVRTLVYGVDVPGYASLLTSILFLGGVQLISIGVLGEYLGRVYMEVKGRPSYIVDREL
ncbi:MAG: glycosyltransferase family 2 protein [Desulfobulbales bacterium]|nr:glycosyltransferase family 2 protein [Desulfobulbales bacterium]